VAIARALITDPKLILMDEPFNNLDPRLRKYLREEYKRIQGELNATTIFVTHDMKEAKELGDRIAIMSNGRIIQVGKFENIISSPANLEVFDFIGQPNILNCDSYELIDYGLAKAYCNNLEIIVPYEDQPIRKIIVYPENIYIYKNKPEGVRINIFEGIVKEICQKENDKVLVYFDIQGLHIAAVLRKEEFGELKIEKGKKMYLKFILREIQVI